MLEIPTFSLVYTSVRPLEIPRVVKLWNEKAVEPSKLEWVICTDEGDQLCLEAATSVAVSFNNVRVVTNTGLKNCTAGWNKAAAVSTGKIIIAVADDFVPPQKWNSLLLSLEPKTWPDEDRVIHVNDGYVRDLCTLAIMTRVRYERYGYLWYPKYQSLFCDTEFTEVAGRDGVVIDASHLLFEHMHPDCGKRARDDADLKHASRERWDSGEMLFKFRRARNFPLDDGPKAIVYSQAEQAVQQTQAVDRYAAYLQVTKDDLCLLEVCQRLAEEGVSDFFFAQPTEYWSGESVEPASKIEVDEIAKKLRGYGLNVQQKVFDVSKCRFGSDDRLTVETRVRNESLTWIRSEGFHNILIVDGDELWIQGTLEMLKPFVEQGYQAISTYMVPVIGLPGFPVDHASDVAVVYIGGDVGFKACRTPTVKQAIIPFPRIYHFTGTRRTMEETIKKHRRSGHYDDPDYDFENWLKNILPNIHVGMENVHMYKKYQIWPRIRAWRSDELQHIPASLHQYLGLEAAAAK